jgi:hypothetical protein
MLPLTLPGGEQVGGRYQVLLSVSNFIRQDLELMSLLFCRDFAELFLRNSLREDVQAA